MELLVGGLSFDSPLSILIMGKPRRWIDTIVPAAIRVSVSVSHSRHGLVRMS